jgi:hypothetical protein
MKEFSLVDPVNCAGLLGGAKKLQEGNPDSESGQPMLFACLLGQASHIPTKGAEKMSLSLPSPDKGNTFFSIKGHHGEFPKDVNKIAQRGFFNIDSEKNISIPGNEKPEKANKSLPGMVNLLSTKSDQKQALGEVKNLLKAGLKASRGEVPKDGGGSIKNMLKNSGLKGEETIVENGKTGVKKFIDHKMKILHKEIPSREVVSGSMKQRLNNLGIEPGPLKPGLSRTIVGKDDAFKKRRGAIPKDGGGKNSIKNMLKNPGLKGDGTIVENGKTGVAELIGNKMKILHKEISSSPSLPDKIFSVGEHHHTSFHGGSRTAAVNGRVNGYGIEARALIDRVAKGVNRPGRVKIALTPPHLGTLDMDVIVRKNKVLVILQTENNDVKHILQSNVETLKSALRSQGLIADNINVFVQERSDSAGHFGFGRNETLLKEHHNQKEDNEYPGERRNSLDYAHSSMDEETPHVLVNGHISLFA